MPSAAENSISETVIFLPYTTKTEITGTTRLMAPTGRISVFIVTTMSTAEGFWGIILSGKAGRRLNKFLMVTSVKRFFEKYIKSAPGDSEGPSGHSVQVATAALLVEMMRADAKIDEDEHRAVMETVMERFSLTEEESYALLRLAEEAIRKATGYYEFTSLINKEFTYEQKIGVIEHLWEIAFADKSLDRYEEHMVRKIADLIYVEHKDFINAKLRVKKKL